MSSMKPWMEGIGDVDLDKSPDDELSPELLGAIRRLSETLKKLDLQAIASSVAGWPIGSCRPAADEGRAVGAPLPLLQGNSTPHIVG